MWEYGNLFDVLSAVATKPCTSGSGYKMVCPVRSLNFACLDVERSLLLCRHIFRISRSGSYIKVVRSWSISQEQKMCLCDLFVCGLPSIEKQYCFLLGSSPDKKKFAGYYITTANEFADMV